MVRGSQRLRDAAGPVATAVVVALLVLAMGPVAAQDEDPRTPSDAMPGHTPVETGEGFAHFQIENTSELAVSALFSEAGDCGMTFAGVDLPKGDTCEDGYPLLLHGDETLVEVVLTWESDRTDLNLFVHDPDGGFAASSTHGQVFVNQVCEAIPPFNECTFVFPPNGTTAEYVALEGDGLFEGRGSIRVTDENNWRDEHVMEALDAGEAPTYTLDVWVYTVPAEPTHSPFEPEPEPEPQPAGAPGPDQPSRPVGPLGALPI